MSDRERLIELIIESGACFTRFPVGDCEKEESEKIADHLLSNGVTIQKHGRWLQEGNAVYMWRHNCSLCGNPVYNKIKPYNYCPNCGAKMDLEE